jgi:hypothetical protein
MALSPSRCLPELLRRRHVAWLAAAVVVLSACASSSTVEPVSRPAVLEKLAFLQPGVTSGREIEARFGAPGNRYEEGRIVTYSLDENLKPSAAGPYQLVLVYQPSGLLKKWSLVDKGD